MPASENSILKGIVAHIQNKQVDPITPLIDEYLIKRELPKYQARRLQEFRIPTVERVRPHGRLSPSSACGCERKAALSFMGVEGIKRTDPDQELLFLDGHWRHHKWDYIFLDMAAMFPNRVKVLAYEEPIQIPKIFVAGSLDIHIAIKLNGKWVRYVIDFKGANNWAFQYVHKNHAPKPEHVLQLLLYMYGKKTRRGAVLYDSKERNNFYIFTIDFNQEKMDEVTQWCKRVLAHIEKHQLPPTHPECRKGNFWGDRCAFRNICYGPKDEDAIEEEIFKNYPGLQSLWREGMDIASRDS